MDDQLNDAPTWRQAIPAMAFTDLPWFEDPMADTGHDEAARHGAELAELIQALRPRDRLGELFPCVPKRLDLVGLDLSTRAFNASRRAGCTRTGDLLDKSVADLLEWRNVGVFVMRDILVRLFLLNADYVISTADRSTEPILDSDRGREDNPPPDEQPWFLLPELHTLARYWCALGRPNELLMETSPRPDAPPHIHDAFRTIVLWEAATFARERTSAAATVDAVLSTMPERARDILRRRVFSATPRTLEQIGQDLGITRERVRQLATMHVRELRDLLEPSPEVQLIMRVLRAGGSVSPLHLLVEQAPALAMEVEGAGEPLWRVLDTLDDSFEIKDGWVARPTIDEALAATRSVVASALEQADHGPVVQLGSLDLPLGGSQSEEDQLAWLRYCGFEVIDDFVFPQPSGIPGWVLTLLGIEGRPMTPEQIQEAMPTPRALTSVKNVLQSHDRLMRTDRNHYGLKSWGLPEYGGIRDAIQSILDREGGQAPLAVIVEEVSNGYSVSPLSVVQYASSHPFRSDRGMVQRAEAEYSTSDPFGAAKVYRRGADWLVRLQVNSDHLRGSGTPVAKAVATVLHLRSGEAVSLESRLGPQLVSWAGLQVAVGSIRRFLLDLESREGDVIFLRFGPDLTFAVEPAISLPADPLARAARLAGWDGTVDAVSHLRHAVGLAEDASLEDLARCLAKRGDQDIWELVDEALS